MIKPGVISCTPCVLVRVLQRKRSNRMYVYIEREKEKVISSKELAHAIVEAWQIQNLRGKLAGWRPREEQQFKFKGSLQAEFLLAEGRVYSLYNKVFQLTG